MKILKAIQIFVLFLFLLSTPSQSQEVNLSALKIPAELKENANAVVRLDQKDIKIISQRAMVITENEKLAATKPETTMSPAESGTGSAHRDAKVREGRPRGGAAGDENLGHRYHFNFNGGSIR